MKALLTLPLGKGTVGRVMGFLDFPPIDLFLFFLRCLFLLGRAGAILYQERCVMVVVVFGGWWWRRTKGMDGLLVQREGEEKKDCTYPFVLGLPSSSQASTQ